MPLYALQTFSRGWHWGQNLCTLVGALDYIISFAEWFSVAMIALTKCINLLKPKLGYKWFSGFRGILLILMIWIYANVMVIPSYLEHKMVSKGTVRSREISLNMILGLPEMHQNVAQKRGVHL